MKEFEVDITIHAEYNADSEEEVMQMIGDEYGLGDVQHTIDITELKRVGESSIGSDKKGLEE